MQKTLHDDPLAHARRQRLIDEAHERHLGKPGKCQHVIDAGAAGEDHLEIRRPLEEIRRRFPHHCIVDPREIAVVVHDVGAIDHLAIGKGAAKSRLDLLRNELQIDDDGALCGHCGHSTGGSR
ncbi:hypothetical protein D9M70_528960 [compost metagenome]